MSPFRLGTFSIAGCPPFPGLAVADRVHALHALEELAGDLGHDLEGTRSALDLLDSWDKNLPALQAIAAALSATTVGPVARRVLASGTLLSQLRIHAPVRPRQIFQAGANYHKHVVDLIVDGAVARDPATNKEQVRANATEMMRKRAANGKPFVFMGLWSSVIGPHDPIVVPYAGSTPGCRTDGDGLDCKQGNPYLPSHRTLYHPKGVCRRSPISPHHAATQRPDHAG